MGGLVRTGGSTCIGKSLWAGYLDGRDINRKSGWGTARKVLTGVGGVRNGSTGAGGARNGSTGVGSARNGSTGVGGARIGSTGAAPEGVMFGVLKSHLVGTHVGRYAILTSEEAPRTVEESTLTFVTGQNELQLRH